MRQAAAEDALTVKAREFLTALDKGDFQLAVRDFDETMLKVSGPDKLEPMWTKQLPAQLGAFKKQAAARRDQLQGYEIVLVTCEFEKVAPSTPGSSSTRPARSPGSGSCRRRRP